MKKNIIIIPTKYPTIFQKHNYIFVEDQAKVLSKLHNVKVIGTITVSLKYIIKKSLLNLGIKKRKNDNLEVILLVIPSIPKLKRLNNLLRYLGNLYLMRNYVNKIDFIHVHTYLAGEVAVKMNKENNIPYFVTEHSSLLLKDNIEKSDYFLAKKVFTNSSRNFAVSNFFAEKLKSKFNVNVDIFHNLIDTDYFYPNRKKKKEEFIFITVGNLVKIKNQKLMIDAFSKAFKEQNNVKLYIIGKGELYEQLQTYIKQLELEKQIKLLGYKSRKEIVEYLNDSDVFISTSKFETFSIAVIEAMSMSMPIICTNFGGIISEIIDLEDCFITDHNIEELVNVMKHVFKYKINYSIENREFVIKNFSEHAFLNKYQSLKG